MRILAVDTSTFLGSVALLEDGALLAEQAASVRAAHGETLLPHLKGCLAAAKLALSDVDLFAVGIGPGSFTGVRIGVATLKGLALAEGTPLVGVSSLRAIARGIDAGAALRVSVIDAYKGEVYCGAYSLDAGGALVEKLAPFHAQPAIAAARLAEAAGDGPIWAAGDGLTRYPEAFVSLGDRFHRAPPFCDGPRGACVAHEAALRFAASGPDDLARLEPTYLRPSDAKLPGGVSP